MAARTQETRVGPDGWEPVIAAVAGPQLVVAGPGAGKTEFLVRRALHLIREEQAYPDSVLLLSFSRRGAADLRARIAAALGRSFTSIPAMTFHSLARRIAEAHEDRLPGWSAAPALLTGPEQVALVSKVLQSEDPADWPHPFRGLLGTQTLANEVADFVLRCRENLVGPVDLAARAAERADWRALPGFLERYRQALVAEGRIDYGTLQALAVELLDDPAVRDSLGAQFRFLLVDEYQDTTVAQARMLGGLYLTHRNLTVAGDPYQSIFSFRGTALDNIARFPESFPDAEGRPARRIVLTTSFRVPAEILEAAVRLTEVEGLPGEAGPVVPAPGRGAVETYAFDQQTHEAEWIAAEVQRLHLRDGIPYRRMAVLVRSKRRFLPELSRALERHRVPHEQPDRRLVDQPAVRVVLDCVRAAAGPAADRPAALRRLLLGAPGGLTLSGLREAEREQARTGEPWPDVLRRRGGRLSAIADLVADPAWAVERPAAEGFWHLWSRLPHIPDLVAAPAGGEDRAAWSSLGQVLESLNSRAPRITLAEYFRWSEAEDFEATPLLEYAAPDDDRLTLATLHQAKGMEFDAVFIADAVEGVFPDLRSRESLLGARHLSPSLPGDRAGHALFRVQEEMRLAYTAMCRARRRVVWTCTRGGNDQDPGLPSRFLSRVSSTPLAAPGEPGPPCTPLEAEAWLRRLLADPAESPGRRLAALEALSRPAPWRPRSPEDYAGLLEPGPDTGLIPPGRSLSPSQADSYLDCPRRYAFERWLGVGAEGSVYASFGSAIHGALEAAEKAALAAGRAHGTLTDALAAFESAWDPLPFGGGEWAQAWRRRGREVLAKVYDGWPSQGSVIAVEHPLSLETGSSSWRGRADRVELRGSPPALYVVDYKTARSAPPVAEAAGSLQLGFYVQAVAADPRLGSVGPVAGAEMWFPATFAKSVIVRRFDPARLEEVGALMAQAAAGIRAECWTPVAGEGCRNCLVRGVCPEWPEGREAFT